MRRLVGSRRTTDHWYSRHEPHLRHRPFPHTITPEVQRKLGSDNFPRDHGPPDMRVRRLWVLGGAVRDIGTYPNGFHTREGGVGHSGGGYVVI